MEPSVEDKSAKVRQRKKALSDNQLIQKRPTLQEEKIPDNWFYCLPFISWFIQLESFTFYHHADHRDLIFV